MSLKSIEMQIALPRTVDASKNSEQLAQRGQFASDYGNLKMHQEEIKQRTTVVKQEQKDPPRFQTGQKDPHAGKKQEENVRKKTKQKINTQMNQTPKHPYKGKFLDYSG